MGKSNNNEELSKSKAKRIERQKEVASQKRKKITSRIIAILICIAVVACVAVFAGISIYQKSKITKSSNDFSKGLNDQGFIDGINVSDYVSLCDLNNFVIPLDEVKATEEEVNDRIDSTLSSYKYTADDASLSVKDGDTVNIDYVGKIDGVEFDGGAATGYNLVIGSGSFIDNFEEQLIGSHPGDELQVNVTFPDEYESNPDLASKPAEFTVKVNGISVTPELTDKFVSENLSQVASTADEYREYVSNDFYNQHLEEYISKNVVDQSTVISYPKNYLKTLKSITKYNDEYSLTYYNNMFASYGLSGYNSVWEMNGQEDEMAYENDLEERAKATCKELLVSQAIYEAYGLSFNFDDYCQELNSANADDSYADSLIEQYGKGYMMQSKISDVVLDYLKETLKVQ